MHYWRTTASKHHRQKWQWPLVEKGSKLWVYCKFTSYRNAGIDLSVESSLVENMVLFVQYISSVRGQLIALSPQTHDNSISQQVRPNILHPQNLCKPTFSVNMDDVSRLGSLGFSWNDFSSLFGISSRTLRRRRLELGIAVMSYDNITQLRVLCC
jgi:hypothetical protein